MRLDSSENDFHGPSCAVISVEAAGVGGRIGVGMSFGGIAVTYYRLDQLILLLSTFAETGCN